MKRSELPLYKDLEKTEKEILKRIARQYGWRQSDYIEWRIESGYFICLYVGLYAYVLKEIRLTIKPLYIDDLWWDVFNLSENKKRPKSLRGLGAFAVSAPQIAKYEVLNPDKALEYSPEAIESILQDLFLRIDKDISVFLTKNPDPELFCPEDGGEYGRISPIYTLTMDLHAGRYSRVIDRIRDYNNKGISSGICSVDSSTMTERDAFDFFLEWCHRHQV